MPRQYDGRTYQSGGYANDRCDHSPVRVMPLTYHDLIAWPDVELIERCSFRNFLAEKC